HDRTQGDRSPSTASRAEMSTRTSSPPRGDVPHRKGGVSSGDFMAAPGRPAIEARSEQMFPTPEHPEVDRLRRIGERHAERPGERIMRALILRRVGLIESGVAGPLIVGHAGDGDVLRLAGFLTRNGHPHHTLDSDSDSCAKTLIERFSVEPSELPIVLCPNGRM